MATLVPHKSLDSFDNDGERDVARALVEQLPQQTLVFHGYEWLRLNRDGRGRPAHLAEGEVDFIILDPDLGLLVLEVKGGRVRYDADTQEWTQCGVSGWHAMNDPFAQARRNMHELVDRLTAREFPDMRGFPGAYGYAVVFPYVRVADPSAMTPAGAAPSVLFTAPDLDRLGRRVRDTLGQWSHNNTPRPLGREVVARVRRALTPALDLVPVLGRQVEGDERVLVRLTDEQKQLLLMMADNPRMTIRGAAGSGKTMLAVARAEAFAAEGRSTLFLCYNKVLAEWVSRRVDADLAARITCIHFHALAADVYRKAGRNFAPTTPGGSFEDPNFWKDEVPDAMFDLVGAYPRRFDAIVVDEAQDFYSNWWTPIEALNRDQDAGPLYIFTDPKQNLYHADLLLPDLPARFLLPRNVRNTRAINAHCAEVIEDALESSHLAPPGVAPEVYVVSGDAERRRRCEAQVRSWLGEGGLRPDQVAILSRRRPDNGCLAGLKTIGGVPVTTDPHVWAAGGAGPVLLSTIKSFKGLEADAVLLLDVPPYSGHFCRSDLYVGCSRAKHRLVILTDGT